MFTATATADFLIQKNSDLYDETSGRVWQLAVYDGLHGGWEFINLGGKRILTHIAQRAGLAPGSAVLEFCCGQAATCRYLAENYGCYVTGIEINPHQVEKARTHLLNASRAIAGRVEIVTGNILDWHSSRSYDAVVSLDSFMLIPNLSRAVSAAYESLRPGGVLTVVTINSGPFIDDKFRQFAWEMDGMISLYSPEDYIDLFSDAGFDEIEVEDFTDLAVENSVKINSALEDHQHEIVREEGIAAYRGWLEVGLVYLSAFRERKLTYQLIIGRRPF
jgi:sarcosine/dimethylglycine N-methyltransferase